MSTSKWQPTGLLRCQEDYGLDGTSDTVAMYIESQQSVYPVAGRVIGDILHDAGLARLNMGARQLLADLMAVMRYANDLIDVYGVTESDLVFAVHTPQVFPVGLALYEGVSEHGDPAMYVRSVEYLLACSAVQRNTSARWYIHARAAEGEAAGLVLISAIAKHLEEAQAAQRLTVRLSIAANLWDTLWDLREDGRSGFPAWFRTFTRLCGATCSLLASRHGLLVAHRLWTLTYQHYLSRQARSKWANQSRQDAWVAYRRNYGDDQDRAAER
jgi:hypothetical protein